MPTTSQPISPFAMPIPPPCPLIVPINATDLHAPSKRSFILIEDLEPFKNPSNSTQTQTTQYHPYDGTGEYSAGKQRAVSSPLSSEPSSPRAIPTPSISLRGSLSPHAGPRVPTIMIDSLKIQHPNNASWINLESNLGWDSDEYKDFRMVVTLSCKCLLKSSKSYLGQKHNDLEKCREEIIGDYPKLKNYHNEWLLEVAIQATLKSSATTLKKNAT